MSKFNIMFIVGWYPSDENPTSGVFVKEHAKAAQLSNNIAVVYDEGIDSSIKNLYTIEDQVEDGLRTLRINRKKSPLPKTNYFIHLWSLFGAYRKLLSEGFIPDIIHANVYSAGVPAVLLGKLYNLPVLITEHFTGFPRQTLKGFAKLKAKFGMNLADKILPVSEYLGDKIKDYGIRNEFQVIPNVVDTELFYPPEEKERKDKKSLLLVALLTPKKGVPYLLKAIAELKTYRSDFVLDIVGDGPKREKYEKMTQKLGIEEIVNFHGLKPKEEVAEFMRKADLFVLPSLFETFGVVLIEAMASGLPVVATDIGGPREIVHNGVGTLVPPKDSAALAQSIDSTLDNLDQYDSTEIREDAESNYNRQAVGKQLDKVYKEVTQRREKVDREI